VIRRRRSLRALADLAAASCLMLVGVLGMWPSRYVLVPVVVLAVLCSGTLVYDVFVRRYLASAPIMGITWVFLGVSAFVIRPSSPWVTWLSGVAIVLTVVAVGLLVREWRRSRRGQQRAPSDEPV
jgi:hypothetical protein